MSVNFAYEAPELIKKYLFNLRTINNKSIKTVNEYYLDLRMFFRFIKINRKLVSNDVPFEEISIEDVDFDLISSVTYDDALEFMFFLDNVKNDVATTRARKCSSIRGFYKFLVNSNILEADPLKNLPTPKSAKSLPKYLTLEQSIQLLEAVDGKSKERDYCILTLFLNCGLRLSELVGINMSDIRSDNTLKVLGKGSKERIIYLNDACINALNNYRRVRPNDGLKDRDALFISAHNKRMSPKTVQAMVYKYLEKIGLDSQGYSCHKLRHTAATLMYQHGNIDIRVLKEVLGHENLGTTEIYTHLNDKQKQDAFNANPLANIKADK